MEKRKVYINKKIAYCGRDCPYHIFIIQATGNFLRCNFTKKAIDGDGNFPEWCPLEKVK